MDYSRSWRSDFSAAAAEPTSCTFFTHRRRRARVAHASDWCIAAARRRDDDVLQKETSRQRQRFCLHCLTQRRIAIFSVTSALVPSKSRNHMRGLRALTCLVILRPLQDVLAAIALPLSAPCRSREQQNRPDPFPGRMA